MSILYLFPPFVANVRCRRKRRPPHYSSPHTTNRIEIDALVRLASDVLTHRYDLHANFAGAARAKALNDILRVGILFMRRIWHLIAIFFLYAPF